MAIFTALVTGLKTLKKVMDKKKMKEGAKKFVSGDKEEKRVKVKKIMDEDSSYDGKTKIKKPVVAKNITFNKDVFWFFDIKIFTLDLLIIVTHYAATSIKLRLFINLLYNY